MTLQHLWSPKSFAKCTNPVSKKLETSKPTLHRWKSRLWLNFFSFSHPTLLNGGVYLHELRWITFPPKQILNTSSSIHYSDGAEALKHCVEIISEGLFIMNFVNLYLKKKCFINCLSLFRCHHRIINEDPYLDLA